jgi:hypothetical protein
MKTQQVLAVFGAFVVICPPLAYGAGYIMWSGGSLSAYGFSVAPYLGARSLLIPGIIYVALMILAVVLGTSVRPQWYVTLAKKLGRFAILLLETATWMAVTVILVHTGQSMRDDPGDVAGLLHPHAEFGIQLVLFIVLAVAIRRTYRLARRRIHPPTHRNPGIVERAVHSLCIATLLYAHFNIAALFGIFSPGVPAWCHPVLVKYATVSSADGKKVVQEGDFLFLEETRERILGFDPERMRFVAIPIAGVVETSFREFSSRQMRLLQRLLAHPLTAKEVEETLGLGPRLSRTEVHPLVVRGIVSRLPAGKWGLREEKREVVERLLKRGYSTPKHRDP